MIYCLLTRRMASIYVGKTGDAMTIENDGVDRDALLKPLTGLFDAVSEWLREGRSVLHLVRSKTWDVFAQAVEQLGWPVREQLIWNKDCFVMGRQTTSGNTSRVCTAGSRAPRTSGAATAAKRP
ncbi:MAG: hypothetical protein ACLUDF_08025 [Butyricicoccus sp.]